MILDYDVELGEFRPSAVYSSQFIMLKKRDRKTLRFVKSFSCRETLERHWNNNFLGYQYFSSDHVKQVISLIEEIENQLNLKYKSKFMLNPKGIRGMLIVELSPFWLTQRHKRSFFTALIKNITYGYDFYFKNNKYAYQKFLSGYTELNFGQDSWCNLFNDKTEEQVDRMLIKKKPGLLKRLNIMFRSFIYRNFGKLRYQP